MRISNVILCAFLVSVATPVQARSQTGSWFGTWKLRLSNPDDTPETLIYSDAGGGAMRMHSIEANSVIVTRFDGKVAADQGSGADKGHALAVKAITGTSYSWTFFIAGKPIVRGRNTLSADHQTFTEIARPVAKPDKVFTLIYERQQ